MTTPTRSRRRPQPTAGVRAVDGAVHNSACPGDNWPRSVDGEKSWQRIAENPCHAGEVGLEITYVTGNGDWHRVRQPKATTVGQPAAATGGGRRTTAAGQPVAATGGSRQVRDRGATRGIDPRGRTRAERDRRSRAKHGEGQPSYGEGIGGKDAQRRVVRADGWQTRQRASLVRPLQLILEGASRLFRATPSSWPRPATCGRPGGQLQVNRGQLVWFCGDANFLHPTRRKPLSGKRSQSRNHLRHRERRPAPSATTEGNTPRGNSQGEPAGSHDRRARPTTTRPGSVRGNPDAAQLLSLRSRRGKHVRRLGRRGNASPGEAPSTHT
jgi:hypothetical protein